MRSSYLLVHWSAAGLYAVEFGVFLFARARWTKRSERGVAFFLVVGPTLYYPVVYLVLRHIDVQAGDYVKFLAEVWAPFWAACSGFILVLLTLPVQRAPDEPPNKSLERTRER
jgi:hypothetical protein